MTTDITIGHFGTVVDVGLASWDVDGDTVRASGFISNTDATLRALCRQQLEGLVPPEADERVVPVVHTLDTSQSGYYAVTGGSVGQDVARYYGKSLPWSCSLVRVPNFSNPDIDILTEGEVRGNVSSYDDADVTPTIAVPADYTVIDVPTTTPASYTTIFGSVAVSDDADYFTRRHTVYRCEPADYYDGACRVEQKIGSTWYPVVGKQPKADPVDIRVNNGLLRIAGYLDGTVASSGIQMESSVSGSTWGPVKTFNFRRSGATLVASGPETVQVLENKPNVVRVAYGFRANTGSVHTRLTVTVRLRRGHRMADITMESPASITWLVRASAAMVAATGGYQAVADDASAQRHVMAIRHASSLTGSDFDVLWTAGSDKTVFGLGVRETGGGSLWGTIADTMHRWFAYVAETQTIET
jgi:uncharacterized protein YerC